MAKKSKSRAYSKKKTAKKKSIRAKAKGGRRTKAGPAVGIGIVSTISVDPSLKRAFEDGFNGSVSVKVANASSYKPDKLADKIDQFNRDRDVSLIVTVGGIVTYRAANAAAQKPFISLLGASPANSKVACRGGVTLNSYASNPERIDHLSREKGFSPNQIGLFQNPNSAMQPDEAQAWTGAQPPVQCTRDSSGNVNPATYASDMARFPASVKAVVISADPFFQESKNELIKAANATGLYLCYPLLHYRNNGGAHKPKGGKTTLFGPSLENAYKMLGQVASLAVNSGGSVGFVQAPNEKDVLPSS